ncbi:MAG TPA: hypothetical protein VEG28_00950 [Dehalococcoidia bacterium]|nr:hypothetical protein [Dehalococcoidia bacterium]
MRSPNCLSENEIEQILRFHLIVQDWDVKITTRSNHHSDVVAVRGSERWVIEVASMKDSSLINSFVAALGELLQRMDVDGPHGKYTVAFPDIKPFRRLWERLPSLMKRKTGITAIFIDETGKITEINE